MSVRDFTPLSGDITNDPAALMLWLKRVDDRQNIDLQNVLASLDVADKIGIFDASASKYLATTLATLYTAVGAALGIGAWAAWTPTRTGWTDVGAPTVTARYIQVGNVVFFQIKVVPATTVATVAGTSYTTLPVAVGGSALAGEGSMMNVTTLIGVGTCAIDVANSRCYVPTQTATGNTLTIFGSYEV